MPAKKKAKKAAKIGRPTRRTQAVERRIIEGLSAGIPLTVICQPDNMPGVVTVYDWMKADPDLSEHIARARNAGWDAIALQALTIADTPQEGIEHTDTPEGPRIKRGDMLGHRKLQVETRLKLLAKWDPKRYGERITQELSGPDGGPIHTATKARTTEEEAAFARLLAEADAKARPSKA
jgi:hypothetical protein